MCPEAVLQVVVGVVVVFGVGGGGARSNHLKALPVAMRCSSGRVGYLCAETAAAAAG
jgi:hypothetical protein